MLYILYKEAETIQVTTNKEVGEAIKNGVNTTEIYTLSGNPISRGD
jgi:hypothetical protein